MDFRKQTNKICFLLIISIIFWGMCLGEAKADSSFLHAEAGLLNGDASLTSTGMHSAVLASSRSQIDSKDVITEREYETTIRAAVRNGDSRTFQGNVSLQLTIAAAFALLLCICPFYLNGIRQEVLSNVIIIGYIHHQDGKKLYSDFSL